MPHRGTSNEYPQHIYYGKIKKIISTFQLKKMPYLEYVVCITVSINYLQCESEHKEEKNWFNNWVNRNFVTDTEGRYQKCGVLSRLSFDVPCN